MSKWAISKELKISRSGISDPPPAPNFQGIRSVSAEDGTGID